jgi:diguanylate cyclase (GGDEF)-like protein
MSDKDDLRDKTEVADDDTLKLRLKEAQSSSPVLVVISGKPLGKSFFLTKDVIILGRDLTVEISIPETSISRKHTEFKVVPQGIQVNDLGSTNGTYVNDQKIESAILNDGDLIRCGSTILKFLKEGKIENIHYGKMYDLATTDDLTNALNKKAILEVVEEEFTKSKSKGQNFTLVLFDLDHFKKVNDTYGHLAGDFVLKETCSLIKSKMIRAQDALGRYGGEEFILALRETPLKIAIDIAERIRSTIEKHNYTFDAKPIPVTISMGVVTLDSTSKSAEDMISLADKALYDAKTQGRNRVCIR